ncbi:PTS sugar transporter subunit IIA [Companilactobacillus halodurans]|uniref:PTS sugar transporter subunit IIA n=1 Tax=Companilactobacillus halodurans TaxID=2584183 RepID=A0A5P0ZNM5_9LACO|nr:PTS sugar transporter subunit IIA [Companilactobacillus halodurans]MQS75441.1 PTS sugar transporter subunit IIA [Companilactobacillus halodurans]MQS97283.1 PTS sugar transporter subunit IIA [Companilactobacillus halodurans]
MKKIIVASHGNMAEGMKNTIELFAGHNNNVSYISAYTKKDDDLTETIDKLFDSFDSDDKVIIFTDLMGGSVNQRLTVKAQDKSNVFIIYGFNLPVVIEAILSKEEVNNEYINKLVDVGRTSLGTIDTKKNAVSSKNDNSDFFN